VPVLEGNVRNGRAVRSAMAPDRADGPSGMLDGRLPPAEGPARPAQCCRPRRCRNNASESSFRFNRGRDFRNFGQSYRPVRSWRAAQAGRGHRLNRAVPHVRLVPDESAEAMVRERACGRPGSAGDGRSAIVVRPPAFRLPSRGRSLPPDRNASRHHESRRHR